MVRICTNVVTNRLRCPTKVIINGTMFPTETMVKRSIAPAISQYMGQEFLQIVPQKGTQSIQWGAHYLELLRNLCHAGTIKYASEEQSTWPPAFEPNLK